jgi:cytoskeleton protein RodZ
MAMNDMPRRGFGAVLRQRREELGLTLNDMAVRTRVHKTYLQALEEENLRQLPGTAYAIGFLRIYARELGLPVAPLLTGLQGGETLDEDAESTAAGGGHRQSIRSKRRKGSGRRLLVWLFLLGLAVAGYFYWQPGRSPAPPPSSPVVTKQPATPPAQPQPPLVVAPVEPGTGPEPAATAAIEFPAIPAGGAVVRMIPIAPGTLKVSLDNQEVREYQLQPDQALNWKVSSSLACELSAPGLVRIWIGEDEMALAEHATFTLRRGSQPDQRP